MNTATKRKQTQRARRAALSIKWVEVAQSERERQQLNHLRIARAGSCEPYSADEYISTLYSGTAGKPSSHRNQRSVPFYTSNCGST